MNLIQHGCCKNNAVTKLKHLANKFVCCIYINIPFLLYVQVDDAGVFPLQINALVIRTEQLDTKKEFSKYVLLW